MNITEQIRLFIRDNFLFGTSTQVDDDTSLLEAGIVDSTAAMELVTFLESAFGIRIDDLDLVPENLDSITAMASFVTRRLAQQHAAGLLRTPAVS